jgi:hypothetical protein
VADLVGTCPKDFWEQWIAEGDAAGTPSCKTCGGEGSVGQADEGTLAACPDCEEWSWYTKHPLARDINPGDRFYVVAHGKLRGWAPVTRVEVIDWHSYAICRRGGAVACTVPFVIPGFRGLRIRWWPRSQEQQFPDWMKR